MPEHQIARRPQAGRLPRPVWLLGWVSFATDTATEAIYPLLPFFLTRILGGSALSLGVIEGVAEAANSALKLASGYLSDRWRVRRPIVVAGYSLSSVVRPFLALATSWVEVLGIRFLDRVGKGLRGAPRDAMLADLAAPESRGRVYGFHRAMDHAGAVIGPLLATVFLFLYPGAYRTLFALTAIPGAIAVALLLRVPEVGRRNGGHAPSGVPVRAAGSRTPGTLGWRALPRSFYRYLLVVLTFTLGNSTDAFLLLRFSDVGVGVAYLPLLWASLHVVKASVSLVGGALSDRWGRRSVIAGGWVVYALVYGGFALAQSVWPLIGCFLAYGLYYGLTEGAERALVADLAPGALRGTAFGLYNAALGVGALVASILFGLVWQTFGVTAAFGAGASFALLATVLLFALVAPAVPRS